MTGSNPDLSRRRFLGLASGAAALTVIRPWSGLFAADARYPETARAWRAMGTLLEVRIPDLPAADAVAAIRRVRERVESLEAAMTLYRPQSPLVAVNASLNERVPVPRELAEGVRAAVDAYAATNGEFDPTVGPMMKAWGLVDLKGSLPSRDVRRRWRARSRDLAFRMEDDVLVRERPDQELDLGGIGKGIAVDGALAVLRSAGSTSALVNLGGSIGVLGAPEGTLGWSIGLAHPRQPGELWAEFHLARGTLATSGDYERFVDTGSGRAHHILDPGSGEPVEGVAAVTCWSPERAVDADVFSTSEFVRLGREEKASVSARALAIRIHSDGSLQEARGVDFPVGETK